MSLGGFADATLGTSASVGRYFGIVSVLPSVVLVSWVYFVSATGAWNSSPDLDGVPKAIEGLGVAGALGLILAALAVAAALHPVQFTLVQLMEGYWGPSRIARRFRLRRSIVHVKAVNHAENLQFAGGELGRLIGIGGDDEMDVMERALSPDGLREAPGTVRFALESRILTETGQALRAAYPHQVAEIMPTRLGNTLRRYESAAGAAYGLPLLNHAAALVMVAKPEHVNYINDQRSSLDLAVRMSAVGLLATAVTFAAMLPHGLWLAATLIPYAAAWLSYRGAVTVAAEYGKGLVAFTDLSRFRLYEELRLDAPATAAAERAMNAAWSRVAASTSPEATSADVTYCPGGGVSPRGTGRRVSSRAPLSVRGVAGTGRRSSRTRPSGTV